jgi:DNA invertase Pin-like site-specific DNA recombinase
VTKLDRLTRSVADFSRLLDRARRRGWQLVVLDLGIDTTTPAGELVANVIASAAQYERRMIGQRTREGMAQRKAEGVHCGRPAVLGAEVVARIGRERQAGRSLRTIAEGLNIDGVPRAHGGSAWHASTVRAVLRATSVPA